MMDKCNMHDDDDDDSTCLRARSFVEKRSQWLKKNESHSLFSAQGSCGGKKKRTGRVEFPLHTGCSVEETSSDQQGSKGSSPHREGGDKDFFFVPFGGKKEGAKMSDHAVEERGQREA